ncbi:MAG: mannitol dehydrogenase family protein [Planctomycetota bacterium]|jgi:mannitol-1-phosphate 5-dehydrogenase
MTRSGKTFVGFGFGPIQSGLFTYEAQRSGNFKRFVVSEIDETLVAAVGANGGRCRINIARRDRIDHHTLEGVELYDPNQAAGREALAAAIAESDEMATALPSVGAYDTGGRASVVSVLAGGLSQRTASLPTILYAAENHNRAAEILTAKLASRGVPGLEHFQALNTVVGKMSGVITDPGAIKTLGLATIAPGVRRAILIEQFNRILISRVRLPGHRRGIGVFEEKDDLLPFEEAKLSGHNAIHALIAYLAELRGLTTIAEAGRDGRIMAAARKAFIEESGPALIARNAETGDELFTAEGYRAYAEDLLDRMVCPFLNDLVSRVGRDHVRKLGYNDRLFGTMRLALAAGVEPVNLALGAAAAVVSMIKRQDELAASAAVTPLPQNSDELAAGTLRAALKSIWAEDADSLADELVRLTWHAVEKLRDGRW